MATNTDYTLASSNSQGIVNKQHGYVTMPATAITATDSVVFTTGFRPRKVVVENVTDRIRIEWYEGMADNSCIKTAANGTRTLEVTGGNGGITVSANGFSVLQNATLAVVVASKVLAFEAIA